MRLVLFNDYIPGVLKGDRVVDISDVVADVPHINGQTHMSGIIERFDQYRAAIERAVGASEGVPMGQVRLRAPLPEPGRMVCMAGNYLEGAPMVGDRDAFLKSPSAVIGHGDTVVLPDVPAENFHHEAELALVIGKTARNVKAEDASDYIFGYMNFMDISAREINPNGSNSFFWGKSWDTFAPMGPAIVTADEVPDPQNVTIKLWVSGDLRQNVSTTDMGRSCAEVLEFITWLTTVKPGDVIATGTNHEGLSPIRDGDTLDMEIADFGKLSVKVRDDWKRTWPSVPMSKMSEFETGIRALRRT